MRTRRFNRTKKMHLLLAFACIAAVALTVTSNLANAGPAVLETNISVVTDTSPGVQLDTSPSNFIGGAIIDKDLGYYDTGTQGALNEQISAFNYVPISSDVGSDSTCHLCAAAKNKSMTKTRDFNLTTIGVNSAICLGGYNDTRGSTPANPDVGATQTSFAMKPARDSLTYGLNNEDGIPLSTPAQPEIGVQLDANSSVGNARIIQNQNIGVNDAIPLGS